MCTRNVRITQHSTRPTCVTETNWQSTKNVAILLKQAIKKLRFRLLIVIILTWLLIKLLRILKGIIKGLSYYLLSRETTDILKLFLSWDEFTFGLKLNIIQCRVKIIRNLEVIYQKSRLKSLCRFWVLTSIFSNYNLEKF